MTAKIEPFYRGDTVTLRISVKTPNLTTGELEPVDITNNWFWITFKTDPSVKDYDASLQKIVQALASGGHPDTNPEEGVVVVVLESTETALLIGGVKYHYDIQRSISGNPPTVRTLVKDTVTVLGDVTHRSVVS